MDLDNLAVWVPISGGMIIDLMMAEDMKPEHSHMSRDCECGIVVRLNSSPSLSPIMIHEAMFATVIFVPSCSCLVTLKVVSLLSHWS